VSRLFPDVVEDGRVDRDRLAARLRNAPERLAEVEKIVHPLVAAARDAFVAAARTPMVVLDIPLLFEAGLEDTVDLIAVVSAPPEQQRARVLARPGMTEEKFEFVLSRQLPDDEKRKRADVVIPARTMTETATAVEALIDKVRRRHA